MCCACKRNRFFSLSIRKFMCVCQRTIIRTWNILLNSVHTSFQRHTNILSKCYTISKIMHGMRYIFMRLDRRWIALLSHSNVCYGKKDVAKIVRTSQHRLCGKFSSNHFTTLLIFVSLSLLRSIFFLCWLVRRTDSCTKHAEPTDFGLHWLKRFYVTRARAQCWNYVIIITQLPLFF